ncbi:uncharacterized protein TNCV_3242971 [Trichonephila clavipes]|nr:uncharacterized protein TNCV_3242971 [Trichonephila clavipes]
MVMKNVSCLLKSSEERKIVNGRQADTEDRVITIEGIGFSVMSAEISRRKIVSAAELIITGLCSISGEVMDVCKCIVPLRHRGTLNSRRDATHLVRLVEREERWKAPDHLQGVFLQNWDELSKIVPSTLWCLKLRRTGGPLP